MENKKRDDIATLTAKACKCTPTYVRLLINGDRNSNTERAKAIVKQYDIIKKAKESLIMPTEVTN
jgi:hypothetical protein